VKSPQHAVHDARSFQNCRISAAILNRDDTQHVTALQTINLPGYMITELNGVDALTFSQLNCRYKTEMGDDPVDLGRIENIRLDPTITIGALVVANALLIISAAKNDLRIVVSSEAFGINSV